jgi:hypothetical protein
VFESEILEKALWTNPGPASEESLKVVFTKVNMPGNVAKIRLLLIMCPKVGDSLLNSLVVVRLLHKF